MGVWLRTVSRYHDTANITKPTKELNRGKRKIYYILVQIDKIFIFEEYMCCQSATSQQQSPPSAWYCKTVPTVNPWKVNFISGTLQLTQPGCSIWKFLFLNMQFSSLTLGTFEIFRLAKLISDNIVYFLPRNVDMDQVSVFRISQTCNVICTLTYFVWPWMSECSCPTGLATPRWDRSLCTQTLILVMSIVL